MLELLPAGWQEGRGSRKLGTVQGHTAGGGHSVGGAQHLCVETPSVSQMKQRRPCHAPHFSASVRFRVWGKMISTFPSFSL